MYEEKLKDSEFWPTWRLVNLLTLREAAWLFSGDDPTRVDEPEAKLPSKFKAISTALLEAVFSDRLPVQMTQYKGLHVRLQRRDGDSLSYVVTAHELASWANANGVPHYWMSAQASLTEDPLGRFPPQLRVAILAHDAVRAMSLVDESVKSALLAWVKENHSELMSDQQERIAVIANWSKGRFKKSR